MSRIIQFRGIRKDNSKWAYGSLTVEFDGTCFINLWVNTLLEPANNYWELIHEAHEVDPETVSQLTGQKDKNENWIYEGDILQSSEFGHTFQVVWNDVLCGFRLQFGNYKQVHLSDRKDYTAVIGNIYENTELLNLL